MADNNNPLALWQSDSSSQGRDNRFCWVPGPVCSGKYGRLAVGYDGSREPFDTRPSLVPGPVGVWSSGPSRKLHVENPFGLAEASQNKNQTKHLDSQNEPQFLYSPAVQVTVNATFGLGTNLTWDAYQRELYKKLNSAFQEQTNTLRRSRNVGEAEVRALIEQRNRVVLEARQQLSPFGKLYSEILKPSLNLPTFTKLMQKKGNIEAILESVGKTRAVTNHLTTTFKAVGHGTIVLEIALTVVLLVEAKPEDRARVAARQGGGIIGGVVGGWGGAWAGCASLSVLASPSLSIPIWGEVSTGGACLIGGILGGFGIGALGAWGGEKAGQAAYDYATHVTWINS
jgi:hypothetical protein